MKRIGFILMAFALAMMMSQCKKNEGSTTSDDEVVTITLDVKNNNSSKVIVNTATGTVDFETGDKIYVGSGGKYVGYLTHNGTNFSGNITNPTENQPLQLYFLGNVTPQETLSAGTTEECSVIISDQTEHLPVISCAASNENYVSGVTAYSAHLLNKCALVKFNVTTPSNSPICITGMKNKVTLDFTQNTMTPSMDGEGVIKLTAGSGENVEKWAILLPQEALEEGEEGSAYSEDGVCIGTRPAISTIADNDYFSQGISFEVCNVVVSDVPVGAINGLFTINANGDQVYFSKGNLQYIGSASTPYWKFAEHQWDYLGDNGQGSTNQNVDRDLFGWGTSGWDNGNTYYRPWDTDKSDGYLYGPPGSYDLTGTYANADWGVYNPISNGGGQVGLWRTLTIGDWTTGHGEWGYLFNTRSASTVNGMSNARYAKAKVNNVHGLILFPDSYTHPSGVAQPVGINDSNNSGWNGNNYSASDFELMEQQGAVFLPAAGSRSGTSVNYVGTDGGYWSSSNMGSGGAWIAYFYNIELGVGGYDRNRFLGRSVRLVQDY